MLIMKDRGEEYILSQEKGATICQPNLDLFWEEDPTCAQLEDLWVVPTGQALEQGCILIASSTLTESSPFSSHLHEVVIFLVRHSSEGSVGLILNRPTILTMERTMIRNDAGSSQIQETFGENRLYCGGNRDQETIKILHRYGDILPGKEIIPGVFVSDALSTAPDQYRHCNTNAFKFFSGFEYWAPGELQKELEMGLYITASCSRTLVLKNCLSLPIPLWAEVLLRMGGEYAEEAVRIYGSMYNW